MPPQIIQRVTDVDHTENSDECCTMCKHHAEEIDDTCQCETPECPAGCGMP